MQIVSRQPSRAEPHRMDALAVLPVFFSLKGKRVILVGGSDAAAWKAELLAAAGARVEIHADDLSEEMSGLIARGAADGELVHVGTAWESATFSGAALAVGDFDGDAAEAFVKAARAAGVPVNVIDNPGWCDFQFGSIVNRSPVVVGISTDGAAPILGQAVRRRIETLLPQSLGEWGRIAQNLRGKIMDRLKPGPERRNFWERFVDRAFSTPPADMAELDRDISPSPASSSGRVTLVGAGPGEGELLTIKAVRALQSADVILFDDLVSDEVLEMARREAKRLLVGKRGGRESCRQEDINTMMLDFARAGKHVVRLKSGDPMIFGRAGEEIETLERQGIAVSVVPGISAANALASRLGISLTHRDFAQSVRFVTGHSKKGGLPAELDWRQLADPHISTVYYMSRRTGPAIAEALCAGGMPPQTPCAVGINLGRKGEKLWRGTLAAFQADCDAFTTEDPFLFAVGAAFGVKSQSAQQATVHQEIDAPHGIRTA